MRSEDEREKNPMDGCRSRSARREEEGSNAGGRGEYVVGGGGGDERRCVGVCASGRCGGQCCSGSNDSQAVGCGVCSARRARRAHKTVMRWKNASSRERGAIGWVVLGRGKGSKRSARRKRN